MPHHVRCIDGHVFDAEISPQCPICGAIVNTSSSSDAPAQVLAAPDVSSPVFVTTQAKAAGSPPRPNLIRRFGRFYLRFVVTSVILGIGFAVVELGLPRIMNLSGETQPARSAAKVDITSTIQAALDVARISALNAQHDYRPAADIAKKLVAQGNSMGAFDLAVYAANGLVDTKNLTEARNQLTAAAKLGDPRSAELVARMMEQGSGGTQEIDGAKALYVFSARNANENANGDLARLNISDQRGMTIQDADNNLIAGKDVNESWQRMNEMIAAHSTPAICLTGWLYINGNSAPQDFKHALDLFKVGAVTNNPSCVWGLSRLVATGLPYLPKNLIEADVLLHLAAADTGSQAGILTDEVAKLEGQMSDEDKAKTQDIIKSGIVPADLSTAER